MYAKTTKGSIKSIRGTLYTTVVDRITVHERNTTQKDDVVIQI